MEFQKKDDENKDVTLEGTKESVEAAKALIEKVIGTPVRVADSSVGKLEELFKKLDLTSKPISEVLFFPETDLVKLPNFERFLSYLRSATKTMDVAVFTITDDRTANVIMDAHRSGIKVRVITDDETMKQIGSDIQKLSQVGIPVKTDCNIKAHMHHKFAVLDNNLLINGSFNWTRQASIENHENMMITNQKEFVEGFAKHFSEMWNDEKNFVIPK